MTNTAWLFACGVGLHDGWERTKGVERGNVVIELRCQYNRWQDAAAYLCVDIIRTLFVVIMRNFMYIFKCMV